MLRTCILSGLNINPLKHLMMPWIRSCSSEEPTKPTGIKELDDDHTVAEALIKSIYPNYDTLAAPLELSMHDWDVIREIYKSEERAKVAAKAKLDAQLIELMPKHNIPKELISKVTNLSFDEIEKIEKDLKTKKLKKKPKKKQRR